MSFLIPDDADFLEVGGPINLKAPVNPNDAVRLVDLQNAVNNLNWKDNVRVSTQGNLNLSSPGATIDGVTMALNDRVLVRAQTDDAENGIYIWNGASTAMTRSEDTATGESLLSAKVTVDEGTDAGTSWRQTEVDITVDTDDILWVTNEDATPNASTTVAGKVELATQAEVNTGTDTTRVVTCETLAGYTGFIKKVAASFGDGSATQFDITHNLGSEDVTWIIREAGGSKRRIHVGDRIHDSNTIRINFPAAWVPTTNQYRIVVTG